MAEMGITLLAENLCTYHAMALIGTFENRVCVNRLPETWPATTGFVFGGRVKKRSLTTHAQIGPCFVVVVVLTGKRGLCAATTADVILFRGEFLLPLLLVSRERLLSRIVSHSQRVYLQVYRELVISHRPAFSSIDPLLPSFFQTLSLADRLPADLPDAVAAPV